MTRILKNYLREEAKDKCHAELPAEPAGLTGRGIPLQPNFSDCGLYLIAYVSQFLKDPANFVTKSVTRQMKEKEDWPDFNAYTLRDNCRNLILGEGKKQNGLSLNAAEQAAIAEREITRPTSQELPMREGSQQVQLSHEVETHQNKQQEQSQWAEADEEDDSGPHRPPTYDGFTRKHIHDIIDDDSDQPKTVENSRPTTVHTEETEGSGAEGGFIPSIAAYAAKSDAQFQHNDEMLLSDEPATSSPQGPQHVSQFFPGSEGASQTSKDVADILGPSPRLVDAFEQKWQDETLKRVKEQYSKSN